MPCLVAFAVLAVMGIFSSTHRALAREALGCIGRRITLRPCDTGFQEKVQGRLIGWLMKRSIWLARQVRKYFEAITWVLFIVTVWSLYATAVGLYNFYFYGSCDGLNASSFCVLDPSGGNNAFSDVDVPADVMLPPCGQSEVGGTGLLSAIPLDTTDYPTLSAAAVDSTNEVIMIGCFECENTRLVLPTIAQLVESRAPQFTFIHYPTKPATAYLTGILQCMYETDNDSRWWTAVGRLMELPVEELADASAVYAELSSLGYSSEALVDCATSEQTIEQVNRQRQEVIYTGIYGTPLIFVNDTPVVGPKPYRVYRHLLE